MIELLLVLLIFFIFANREGFSGQPVGKLNTFYKTREEMRKLFSERSMWIKIFIEDNLQGSSDRNYIYERLLKNQSSIGKYVGEHIKNSS